MRFEIALLAAASALPSAIAQTPEPTLAAEECTFSTVYHYTGGVQIFGVPSCTDHVSIEAVGARGGIATAGGFDPFPPGAAGLGGRIIENYMPVDSVATPIFFIFVGGHGEDNADDGEGGFNGGGDGGLLVGTAGGGASDVRAGGIALEDRIIVAGGGAGGGGAFCANGEVGQFGGNGAHGGGLVADDAPRCAPSYADEGIGGYGGNQTHGGKSGADGRPGEVLDFTVLAGGLGYGSDANSQVGGGAGGGYYGGSAGGIVGGGGGSSFSSAPDPLTSIHQKGVQNGHGYVVINYTCPCLSPTLAPVTNPTLDPSAPPTRGPTPFRNNNPSAAFTFPPTSADCINPVADQTRFDFTGTEQTYQVPLCAEYVWVEAAGARGGINNETTFFPPGQPGKGARIFENYLPVTGGSTLSVFVGGHGNDNDNSNFGNGGFNGGGDQGTLVGTPGGGASDVRTGPFLGDRVVVAAGGGGAGGLFCSNGEAGERGGNGASGGGMFGFNSSRCAPSYEDEGIGGGGATPMRGGLGGAALDNQGNVDFSTQPGQFGVGADANTQVGGGGGGGYYGGGAGGIVGGGGGSSFSAGASTIYDPVPYHGNDTQGHGYVIIGYDCGCGVPTTAPIPEPTAEPSTRMPTRLPTLAPIPDNNNQPSLGFTFPPAPGPTLSSPPTPPPSFVEPPKICPNITGRCYTTPDVEKDWIFYFSCFDSPDEMDVKRFNSRKDQNVSLGSLSVDDYVGAGLFTPAPSGLHCGAHGPRSTTVQLVCVVGHDETIGYTTETSKCHYDTVLIGQEFCHLCPDHPHPTTVEPSFEPTAFPTHEPDPFETCLEDLDGRCFDSIDANTGDRVYEYCFLDGLVNSANQIIVQSNHYIGLGRLSTNFYVTEGLFQPPSATGAWCSGPEVSRDFQVTVECDPGKAVASGVTVEDPICFYSAVVTGAEFCICNSTVSPTMAPFTRL